MTGARVAATFMNFYVTSHLAHVLGPKEYGINTFAFSVINYLVVIVGLGYDQFLTREISANPALTKPLVDHALFVRLALAAVVGIILAATLVAMDEPGLTTLIVVIYALNLLSTAISLTSVYTGLHQMRTVAIRELVSTSFAALGVVIFVRNAGDLVPAALIVAGTQVIANGLIFFRYCVDFGFPRFTRFNRSDAKIIQATLSYFVTLVMIAITYNSHIVILEIFRGPVDTGLFGASWKLFIFVIMVPSLISTLFMPRISALGLVDQTKRDVARLCMQLISICVVPAAILGWALAPQILLFLFGLKFVSAVLPTRLLLLNALVVALNIAFATPLSALGRQRDYMWIVGAGAIMGLGLNILLIPSYGATGAAIGTLVAELVILVLFALFRPEFTLTDTITTLIYCALASAPGYILVVSIQAWGLFERSPFSMLVICGGLGGVSYFGLLTVLPINLFGLVRQLKAVR